MNILTITTLGNYDNLMNTGEQHMKKIMKKMFLLGSLFLLCGCSTEETNQESFTYILFATPLKEHAIWLRAKDGFDAACRKHQIKCDWMGPSVIDTQKMNSVIETGILQKADAIITQGVIDPQLVEAAYKVGIPVVLVDSDIADSYRFVYMGKDFHIQAKLLLAEIEQKYDKKKPLKIAIQVAEKSFSIAQEQIAEIEEVFKDHEGGYEIVSISESKSDQVRAKKEWENVLSQHEDINVAINFAAESAQPCAELVEETDRRNRMLIYGVDDMPVTLEMIREGKIDGTVVTSFYDYGYKSVEILLDYIQYHKEPAQKIFSPSLVIVNKENIDMYER